MQAGEFNSGQTHSSFYSTLMERKGKPSKVADRVSEVKCSKLEKRASLPVLQASQTFSPDERPTLLQILLDLFK